MLSGSGKITLKSLWEEGTNYQTTFFLDIVTTMLYDFYELDSLLIFLTW